ncbi:HAD family hydrolase [Hutsoniella sourekii]
MMKTVIFDMDGVLVDSEYTYLESKTEILKEAGYDKDISYQYQFMGTTGEYMWSEMKRDLDLPEPVNYYIDLMDFKRHEMISRDGVRAVEGSIKFVRQLVDKGFRLAVASSSTKDEIIQNMQSLGIDDCFEILLSSEEVANSKPEPDVFLKVAELMGVSPTECVVIEDTRNGTLSAYRAGTYCIGFANPDYPNQDLSVAHEIVTSFRDIDIESLKNEIKV